MKRLFFNGRIYTMDSEDSVVEAVLSENGMIVKTGSDKRLLEEAGEDVQRVDLQGRTVVPGFNDTHLHLMVYGKSLDEVNLMGVCSVEEVLDRARRFMSENPLAPGQWLLGAGWNEEIFRGRKRITRDDLDQISTEIPIVLSRMCHHVDVCNSKALDIAGIAADTVIPEGEIEVEDNRPTGVIREAAVRYMRNCVPKPDREARKNYILKAMDRLSALGITSVHSDDFIENGCEAMEIYQELNAENRLKVRISQQCRFSGPTELQAFIDSGHPYGSGDDNYRIGALKLLADGSLGGRTAGLHAPYHDDPSTAGIVNFSEELLTAMIRTAHLNGMPVAIHGIGDRTIDMIIDGIERAQKEFHLEDVRHGIVHCQITSEAALDRIAKNRISALIQPIFVASDSKIVEKRVGIQRAKHAYNWKTLKEKGVLIGFGTDCPIEKPSPFENIFCAVNRCDMAGVPAGGWLPEEKLTVEESVRAYTVNGACCAHEERVKGSLEPGKLADMAVLSLNIFEIDPMRIKDTECLMTIKGGEVVYRCPE